MFQVIHLSSYREAMFPMSVIFDPRLRLRSAGGQLRRDYSKRSKGLLVNCVRFVRATRPTTFTWVKLLASAIQKQTVNYMALSMELLCQNWEFCFERISLGSS